MQRGSNSVTLHQLIERRKSACVSAMLRGRRCPHLTRCCLKTARWSKRWCRYSVSEWPSSERVVSARRPSSASSSTTSFNHRMSSADPRAIGSYYRSFCNAMIAVINFIYHQQWQTNTIKQKKEKNQFESLHSDTKITITRLPVCFVAS